MKNELYLNEMLAIFRQANSDVQPVIIQNEKSKDFDLKREVEQTGKLRVKNMEKELISIEKKVLDAKESGNDKELAKLNNYYAGLTYSINSMKKELAM